MGLKGKVVLITGGAGALGQTVVPTFVSAGASVFLGDLNPVQQSGVTALKADWTNRDPAIGLVLGSLGRSGVPLYVLYPAGPGNGAAPTLLPQLLTEGAVIDALDKI